MDSPPGAGKSTLVKRATGRLTGAGHQVVIVAQTDEQVDDLVDNIAREYPDLPVGRLHKKDFVLPERVCRHANVRGSNEAPALRDLPVVVFTAKKWSHVPREKCAPWRWAIVDTAYQMRSDALPATAPLFSEDDSQVLIVGDAGQLDPFATVETDRWSGLTWDPLRNAVDVTLAHNPTLLRRGLPVSWRLPETAAPPGTDGLLPLRLRHHGSRPRPRLRHRAPPSDRDRDRRRPGPRRRDRLGPAGTPRTAHPRRRPRGGRGPRRDHRPAPRTRSTRERRTTAGVPHRRGCFTSGPPSRSASSWRSMSSAAGWAGRRCSGASWTWC
ncbi:AAA family ATPase [Streptomyces sp. R44]|uniref:AAA family ATPase n=1 Tax=Streptomyces sp. R44 TaxID=3238633 RepID=A0AB39SQK9_9ACTN